MGIFLQGVGIILGVAGALAFAFVALGVGSQIDSSLYASVRPLYEQLAFSSTDDLGGRLKHVLAFLVLVGPGIALFYLGKRLKKPTGHG